MSKSPFNQSVHPLKVPKPAETHDRLQAECFKWMWNTYPQTRKCCFAVPNEQALLGFVPAPMKPRILGAMKSIGLVPGVYDLLFYWRGVLYGFDAKVGRDRLSDEQTKFAQAIEAQGGKCFTFGSVDEFKGMIAAIMVHTGVHY